MIENLKLTLYLTAIGLIIAIIVFTLIRRRRIIIYKHKKLFVGILMISIIFCVLGYKINDYVVNKNNGEMPVLVSDIYKMVDDVRHSLSTSKVKYELLTDIFYFKYPVEGMYSIGDIFLELGWITFISVLTVIILVVIEEKAKK